MKGFQIIFSAMEQYYLHGEKMCIVEHLVRCLPTYVQYSLPPKSTTYFNSSFLSAMRRDLYKLRAFTELLFFEDVGQSAFVQAGGFHVYSKGRHTMLPYYSSFPEIESWADDALCILYTEQDPYWESCLQRIIAYIRNVVVESERMNQSRKKNIADICHVMYLHIHQMNKNICKIKLG